MIIGSTNSTELTDNDGMRPSTSGRYECLANDIGDRRRSMRNGIVTSSMSSSNCCLIRLTTIIMFAFILFIAVGDGTLLSARNGRRVSISNRSWFLYAEDVKRKSRCVSPIRPNQRMSADYYNIDNEHYGYMAWERDRFKRALQQMYPSTITNYNKLVDIDSDRTGTKADNASSTSVGGATSRFIEPLLRYSLPDRCVEPPPPPPPTPNHGESLERQRFEDIIINLILAPSGQLQGYELDVESEYL